MVRAVLDGHVYDTKTAKQIHSKFALLPPTDEDEYVGFVLYLTPEGQFFEIGVHGPRRSPFGYGPYPVDRPSAAEWLKRHDAPASAYEAAGIAVAEQTHEPLHPTAQGQLARQGEGSMHLEWAKCIDGAWCSLQRVALDNVRVEGVYLIWLPGNPGTWIYAGQGNIADRLKHHRQDPRFSAYQGLCVSWASVPVAFRNGVERYLYDSCPPVLGDRSPDEPPIVVNLPR